MMHTNGSQMRQLVPALAMLSLVILAAAGCESTSSAQDRPATRAFSYEADNGPGVQGERTQIPGSYFGKPGEVTALKTGRRTYEVEVDGFTSTIQLPPQRYVDLVEAEDAKPDVVVAASCEAASKSATASIRTSSRDWSVDAFEELAAEDRIWALSEGLVPGGRQAGRDSHRLGCDPQAMSLEIAQGLPAGTREIIGAVLYQGQQATQPLDDAVAQAIRSVMEPTEGASK